MQINIDYADKQKIEQIAEDLARPGVMGYEDPLKLLIEAEAIKKTAEAIRKKLEDSALAEAEKYENSELIHGAKVERATYAPLDYDQDDVCAQLNEQISKRKQMLKQVTETGLEMYDDDGAQIPALPSKSSKTSLRIKIQNNNNDQGDQSIT
jgi:hypothetical protein